MRIEGSSVMLHSQRFPNPEGSFSGAVATLLDPRFKRIPFSDDSIRRSHEDRILSLLGQLFASERSTSTSAEAEKEDEAPPAKKSFMQSFFEKVNFSGFIHL